jgi:hypothetical protein
VGYSLGALRYLLKGESDAHITLDRVDSIELCDFVQRTERICPLFFKIGGKLLIIHIIDSGRINR